MSYRDVYIAEKTMERSLEERRNEAEAANQAQARQRQRLRWLARQFCRFLCYSGNRISEAGVRLESRLLKPTAPLHD